MRRDELGIIRFRYVRESEFNAIPEQDRDLYTRYIVFKDDSDEIIFEYLSGQRIETAGFASREYVDEYVDNEITNAILGDFDIDLSDYATKAYVDNEIANVDIDLSDYIKNEDIKEVISGVSYNTTNHKITFSRYNDVDITIDLPIEALLVGLSLDGDDLVLELEDGSTQRVALNTLLVGVVKKVNGQTPNSNGEVNLSYSQITGLQDIISGKQDKLTAGDNITIDPVTNVISSSGGGGSEYELTKAKIETALKGWGSNSIQLGSGASAPYPANNAIALGRNAIASGNYSATAIGNTASASGGYSTVLGSASTASGNYSIALGNDAKAQGLNSIAIGQGSLANGLNSIAIGRSTVVSEDNVADFGSSRQVRVNLVPVNDRDAVSKSYLEDVISSISGGSGGGPVDWDDIENKPNIPSNTSDLINDSDYTTKTYVDNEIANIDIDLSDYIKNEDIKEVISGVSYNTLDHKITFNRYNDIDIVVDLPIENLLVGLSLDGDDLVLALEDGTTTRVPLNTLLVGVVKEVNGKTPNSSGVVNLDYSDLNNLPNLFSGDYEDLINKPELFSKDYNDLLNKPELFSKDYNDLTNKPDLKVVATTGSYNDLLDKPSIPGIPDIPSKTSDLTNDSGFTTTTYVDNKDTIKERDKSTYIKFWTGTQAEYNSLIMKYSNTIYFIEEE